MYTHIYKHIILNVHIITVQADNNIHNLPISFCPKEGSKVRPFAWNCWDSQETRSVGERASENAVGLVAVADAGAVANKSVNL
jgi:hypothetical protein